MQSIEKQYALHQFEEVYDRSIELKNDREVYFHLNSSHHLGRFEEALERVMQKTPDPPLRTTTLM
jgi:chorismate-pyruvate lyase